MVTNESGPLRKEARSNFTKCFPTISVAARCDRYSPGVRPWVPSSIAPAIDAWLLFVSLGLDSELVWNVLFGLPLGGGR